MPGHAAQSDELYQQLQKQQEQADERGISIEELQEEISMREIEEHEIREMVETAKEPKRMRWWSWEPVERAVKEMVEERRKNKENVGGDEAE